MPSSVDPCTPDAGRWNHNIHYHPVLLAAVPRGARRALDIGCGEGLLTRQLRSIVPEVMGIDLDQTSIDRARQAVDPTAPITYVAGDALAHPFDAQSFDMVVSVAAIHHMDPVRALRRMTWLLKPGGVLGIVGLARSSGLADLVFDGLTFAGHALRILPASWEHGAPNLWPPPHTFADMRKFARELLPGSEFRRRLLGRYTLIWTKP
jgi:ubiquinone/menaquinone biosynthesis C-methylase UbiE